MMRHYYVCCRDGNYRKNLSKRATEKQRVNQKLSRKIDGVCLSRMYINEYKDHVEVTCQPTQTTNCVRVSCHTYLCLRVQW